MTLVEFDRRASRILKSRRARTARNNGIYWMNRKGEVFAVGFADHAGVAYGIMEKLKLSSRGFMDAQDYFYKRGWRRVDVTNWRMTISGGNPLRAQKKVIKEWCAVSPRRGFDVW